MNKRKIAVFVEGKAEYIFVREFLLKWYGYDGNQIGIDCVALKSNDYNKVPHPYGSSESENFYLIVNVGNDNSVLSQMKKEATKMRNNGYQLISGLRDMFCDAYHKAVKNRTIQPEISQRFIHASLQEIENDAANRDILSLHFAIMEIEAWLLGMRQTLQAIDTSLTYEYIYQQLAIDLNNNPETCIYHPAERLNDIYKLKGKTYGKHEGDIEAILACIQKEDFCELYTSPKCSSFNRFIDSLV